MRFVARVTWRVTERLERMRAAERGERVGLALFFVGVRQSMDICIFYFNAL